MTYHMLKYLEGYKRYKFLTDFVFETSRQTWSRVNVVICSSYMNVF